MSSNYITNDNIVFELARIFVYTSL